MSYFEDLTTYSYIPEDEGTLLNVGWLDADHEYPKGTMSEEFIEKLAWLCVNASVKGTPGIHSCTLCPSMRFGFHMINLEGSQWVLGSAEIRVRGQDATYASPDLILHYTMEHKYRPPADFVAGVLMLEAGLPHDQWAITRGPHWRK